MDNKSIKDWAACVKFAKTKLPQTFPNFSIIKNKQLIELARKCYCAKGYTH